MRTVDEHPHSFPPQAWPFADPPHCAGFTTARLWSQKLPILRAFHGADGDWQFFHGDIADDDECLVVCLGCLFERDSTIAVLGTLPRGWSASRESVGGVWHCEPDGEEESAGGG